MQDNQESNRRIARNTAFLYFRMLLLLFVGLFTSRIVLSSLGESDYGVYGAVGGVIMMMNVITSAISTAITRYITCELGKGDTSKLKAVFSTSLFIQIGFCVLVLILTETLGIWFLNNRMNIPAGRMGAANCVLQCSMGVLMANLLSVPFNAVLMARERMKAFALISILEAILKLAVAFCLSLSGSDKLILYSILMLMVAILIRLTYGAYCKKHFAESREKPEYHPELIREMGSFAGWNVLGGGTMIVNSAGINLLSNIFFGVIVNAARSIATQIDGIVKQFVNNVVIAINPQITKSYVSGDKDRAFDLVRQGSKYASLIILTFAIPIWFEADFLLEIWLREVPVDSALFTRLTLCTLFLDLLCTTFSTLILAHGDIRKFYLLFSSVSLLVFPFTWIAFIMGAPAYVAYVILIVMYIPIDIIKLAILSEKTGFPKSKFLSSVIFPVSVAGIIATSVTFLVHRALPEGWLRLFAVLLTSTGTIAICILSFGLSPDEKRYLRGKQLWFLSTDAARLLPDSLYLKWKFRLLMGRRLNLRHPITYSEKLQVMKLRDRNPLYTTLADKIAVKEYVAGKVQTIPTLGTWNSAEDIDWSSLPDKFVLKCNHDSGSAIICRNSADFDRKAAIGSLKKSLSVNYYVSGREWPYKNIPRRILAEPLLEGDIRDYKFFCFDGRPELMFIASDRQTEGEDTKFDFYDMDFNHLSILNGHLNASVPPSKPLKWEEMKMAAATLSAGLPAVRVDFYEVEGEIYFGEYTFFHWSGMKPWTPEEWDVKLGNMMKRI